jgi:hypothetical protein
MTDYLGLMKSNKFTANMHLKTKELNQKHIYRFFWTVCLSLTSTQVQEQSAILPYSQANMLRTKPKHHNSTTPAA